jgi:hypothetical protein
MKHRRTQAGTVTPLFVSAGLFLLGMLVFALAEIAVRL